MNASSYPIPGETPRANAPLHSLPRGTDHYVQSRESLREAISD